MKGTLYGLEGGVGYDEDFSLVIDLGHRDDIVVLESHARAEGGK